jgi:hypothetical protein
MVSSVVFLYIIKVVLSWDSARWLGSMTGDSRRFLSYSTKFSVPLPYTFIPIYYSLIVLLFDAKQSDVLNVSLNKLYVMKRTLFKYIYNSRPL